MPKSSAGSGHVTIRSSRHIGQYVQNRRDFIVEPFQKRPMGVEGGDNFGALWCARITAARPRAAHSLTDHKTAGFIPTDYTAILAVALNRPLLQSAQRLFGKVLFGLRLS